ncbi:hypothetical protein HPO96_20790 [Kribbella sandramycini]|uniref:TrbL/VirB6 plasmid conjugal transfer protein n=1 Tax=Kribbella sandramycini TaxID=60450 RepID=A0A7Y4L3A8_9ACTN|nr:hypothetical protein [Kribbella sandramycini]MBB6566661.1 hypothetical protein [Kribbella sandramycini]NOL42687.1 hypothetical protein [Kribbella sandramycini]
MDWIQCLINPTACVAAGAAESASESMWQSFVEWMAKGMSDLTTYVFTSFSESTSPQFDQAWWNENLGLMVAISLPILVAMFIFQCLSALVRREPGRLGHAVVGALVGTAGVPLAVAVVAGLGRVVDQISGGILQGTPSAVESLKSMVTLTAELSLPTLGGSMMTAITLGLLAVLSLYFVMLIREVAIVAFVVFAPIAMTSWTWSATRHWLRRWIEIVAALLFSKIAMAMIFTLGLSATGNATVNGDTSIGTFLTGILLFAMAAFAPLATFSFVHWAGDHAGAAAQLFQQGAVGASALKQRAEQGYGWAAHHFGGSSGGGDSSPVVGDQTPGDGKSSDEQTGLSLTPGAEVVVVDHSTSAPPSAGSDHDSGGSSATAVATSQVAVSGQEPTQQSDTAGSSDTQGGDQR